MMRWAWLLMALTVAWPVVAQEAERDADDISLKTGVADDDEEKDDKPAARRRPKLREDSLLVEDPPMPETVRATGAYERRLEMELQKHFRRLAVLDRILEVAEANDDTGLSDRADQVRRKEMQRFRAVLKELRVQSKARRRVGF